jgi:hypothetical protein
MKLYDRQWQAVNDTLTILCHIQILEHHSSNEIEGLH